VPTAVAIGDDGQLVLSDEDKIALLKKKLAAVPPAAFATLDTNRDGFLSKEELRRGFEALGEPLTDPELLTIVAMADTDKDGKVRRACLAPATECAPFRASLTRGRGRVGRCRARSLSCWRRRSQRSRRSRPRWGSSERAMNRGLCIRFCLSITHLPCSAIHDRDRGVDRSSNSQFTTQPVPPWLLTARLGWTE